MASFKKQAPVVLWGEREKDRITWGKKASVVNIQFKASCMEDGCLYAGTPFTVEISLQYWENCIKNGIAFSVLLSFSFCPDVGNKYLGVIVC